ncbi:MAG: hypothetical protein ACLFSQ_11060 [Candidatus Zixiibacteriota bacterium]
MTEIARPFLGNIENSRAISASKVYEAKIVINTGRSLYDIFKFDDGHFHISPVNWRPKRVEYSYKTLSGRHIEKVSSWEPYWLVNMDFAGRERWLQLMNLIYHMTGSSHIFGSSGIESRLSFIFYPPGDSTRPGIKIMMPADKIQPQYLGRKYMGYKKFSIILIADGTQKFERPTLPKAARLIGKIAGGSLFTDSHIRTPEIVIND